MKRKRIKRHHRRERRKSRQGKNRAKRRMGRGGGHGESGPNIRTLPCGYRLPRYAVRRAMRRAMHWKRNKGVGDGPRSPLTCFMESYGKLVWNEDGTVAVVSDASRGRGAYLSRKGVVV